MRCILYSAVQRFSVTTHKCGTVTALCVCVCVCYFCACSCLLCYVPCAANGFHIAFMLLLALLFLFLLLLLLLFLFWRLPHSCCFAVAIVVAAARCTSPLLVSLDCRSEWIFSPIPGCKRVRQVMSGHWDWKRWNLFETEFFMFWFVLCVRYFVY